MNESGRARSAASARWRTVQLLRPTVQTSRCSSPSHAFTMTDALQSAAQSGDDAVVTIRVPRTVLYAVGGLLTGIMLGASGAYVALRPGQPETPPPSLQPTAAPTLDTRGRPARGSDRARVTVVEFTDYECPFCRQHARQTLPLLLERYGDRVRYVVMNYPIAMLHETAVAAAEAAECAADQGRFWEYHDQLFATDSLTNASLGQIAARLKLDSRTFTRCVDTHARAALVQRHVALGDLLGVTGTPSFFVNGRRIDGAMPVAMFQTVIDSVLAAER